MNIERETKLTITVSFNDLIDMLREKHPNEFLLNQNLVWGRNVDMAQKNSAIVVTFKKASQGPAEIDFNRMQRQDPDGFSGKGPDGAG